MRKALVGQHLMRTRIRKSMYERLQEVAEEESDLRGEHVTVSDLVRAACYNYLLTHESLRRLECSPPPYLEEEQEVWVDAYPMLQAAN